MIPNYENKKTEGGGQIVGTLAVTLKQKNIRHVIKLIRDSVYTDKELAPLREYSTNAYDAQVVSGNAQTPIRVTLPTLLDPQLKIRDFGPGLTQQEMEDIYLSIGESTKRGNNDETGSMGLGSKSGYAYGDSFIVKCWKNGRSAAYNLVLDDSCESGCRCDILFDRTCSSNEHGVEIVIPIREEHIRIFPGKALNFFKYWSVFPEIINLEETEKNRVMEAFNKPSVLSGDGWVIKPKVERYSGGEAVALMANIPYPIDWKILRDKMTFANEQERVIFDFLSSNDVIFYVKNGDLDFSVSREGLQYTDRTVAALSTKVKEIANSVLNIVVDRINKASNLWEAKRIFGSIFNGNSYYRKSDDEAMLDDTGFAGELHQLQPYFKNKLIWNGININSSTFDGIQYWDAEAGKQTHSSNRPLMETFTLDGNFVKARKANHRRANSITPTTKAIIVVNDTGKKKGGRLVCKYILQQANPGGIVRVHFLNFGNEDVKKAFYSEYGFDTVPVTKMSDWLEKAKNHSKKNRVSGSDGGRESAPAETYYIAVTEGASRRYTRGSWSSDVLDLRDEEGYYVQRPSTGDRDEVQFNPNRGTVDITDLSGHIWNIASHFNLDIDKIHGLTSRTIDAKWFAEAKKEGQWTHLFDFISGEIKGEQTEEMMKAFAYIEARKGDNFKIGKYMVKMLRDRIVNPDSPINKLIEAEDAADLNADNVKKYENLYQSLQWLGFTPKTDSEVDFNGVMKEVVKAYPLLWKLDEAQRLQQDKNDGYYKIEKSLVDMIVEYINLKDNQNLNVSVNNNELVAA